MLSRAIKSIKGSGEKSSARRMANTEKYVGGRGAGEGVLRTEKRNNGRLRTSKVQSNIGTVLDVSATGCRVSMKKKPTLDVGASVKLELNSADITVHVPGEVMWVRVQKDCTFHMGVRFTGQDPDRTRALLELLRNGVANEGLTRGWSPLAGFLHADKLGE